eukprot:TRINITY_DN5044_c0_g1_i1.p1 TRINITY_DN5044_c0_g1~~TRINITY_DN5044_c0_g1_i1.p1  ORF type:complete len:180 (-),score=24.70 TRINITY_DN5044_c0_g1_i1:251-790(-)
MAQPFTHHLCGCCDGEIDWGVFCMSCWCPCIQFGMNVEAAGLGECETYCLIQLVVSYFVGCPCIVPCLKRTEMRNKYGLMGDPYGDCCTHYWCHCCALIQEAKEIRTRGETNPLPLSSNPLAFNHSPSEKDGGSYTPVASFPPYQPQQQQYPNDAYHQQTPYVQPTQFVQPPPYNELGQ